VADAGGWWDPAEYGDRFADVYDDWYGDLDAALPDAVAFLARTAGAGAALELGIGTGRVAVPLAQAGVRVAGVDASERMVARLWSRPSGDAIPVVIGDFGDPAVLAQATAPSGGFSLVYAVFNTFFALPTQADQVRCLAATADVLVPGGAFVMQAIVPDQARYAAGPTRFAVHGLAGEETRLAASVHDRNAQTVRTRYIVLGPRGVETYPANLRYAFPAELDLMARLAGLDLESRTATWAGEPFTNASGAHISTWRKPA
jgi:SAM-dependent methyltransferase